MRVLNLPNGAVPATSRVKYPSHGWGQSLERVLFFTKAEMNHHVSNSEKLVTNAEYRLITTNLRKAKTFLQNEYLKEIKAILSSAYVTTESHEMRARALPISASVFAKRSTR